jgi:hypothetical protein
MHEINRNLAQAKKNNGSQLATLTRGTKLSVLHYKSQNGAVSERD